MAASSIKCRFLVVGTQLIQAGLTPQETSAGKTQGDTLGVRVELQPLDLPAGVAPNPTGIQLPFYGEDAGDLLTSGKTLEISVSVAAASPAA